MSLREEIISYLDKLGYVAPNIPDQDRGSDNGTMFTSEYYIMLKKLGEATPADVLHWVELISKCQKEPGLTIRYPGDHGVDAPDNFYGILAACKVLEYPYIAEDILKYGLKHFGFYNPTDSFKWDAFHFRQLQLVFSMLCASNKVRLWKFWQWPLALYTALVILVSCLNTPPENTDVRRLCYLLIHTVKDNSWLCWLASKVWLKRLLRDYPNGMVDVCKIYYKDNHPFGKYIDKNGWIL